MNHWNNLLDPIIQEIKTVYVTEATWININGCHFSGLSGSH